MRVISRDSMGISICPHYVRICVTSHATELTQVKEKPCIDVLLYICVYVRLIVYKESVSAIPSVVDFATFTRRSFHFAYEHILTNT